MLSSIWIALEFCPLQIIFFHSKCGGGKIAPPHGEKKNNCRGQNSKAFHINDGIFSQHIHRVITRERYKKCQNLSETLGRAI